MTPSSPRFRERAFTLVEALIGAGVSSVVLAALALGTVALSRTFRAVEDYSVAAIDQARVLDYIARDVRRALSVSVTADPVKLTLTVPNQYAKTSPAREFSTPIVTSTSVTYGGGTIPIAYYVSGTTFVRQEGGIQTVIATNVADFIPNFDSSDPNGKTLKTTISFMPLFRSTATTGARTATALTNRVFLRNK